MKLEPVVFTKWQEKIGNIESDLQWLVNNQQIFNRFMEVVSTNADHIADNEGAAFCSFVRRCYGVQAAVGVRRHASLNDKTSLMYLLNQIYCCADQFTYEFMLQVHPQTDGANEWQRSVFDAFSGGGKTLSARIIEQDRSQLAHVAKRVTPYVDRRIAHLDHRGAGSRPTYRDLQVAIDEFNRLCCRYLSLIRGISCESLTATIINDWEQVFRVPFNVVVRENP